MFKVAQVVAVLTASLACLQGQTVRPACFPRGTADYSSQIGFSAAEDGSILAIDLKTGNQVWTSKEAKVPLVISEHRLAAADTSSFNAGQFSVVLLDAQTGKLLLRSQPIFTGQSGRSSEDTPRLQAVADQKYVTVSWARPSIRQGGAPPPLQRDNSAPSEALRVVNVDLSNGRITPGSTSKSDIQEPLQSHSQRSVAYRREAEWARGSWNNGDSVANIEQVTSANQSRFRLRVRERATNRLKAFVYLGPTDSGALPFVTADGNYVIMMESTSGSLSRVYSAKTGLPVGRAALDPAAQDICIFDSRLFFIQGGEDLHLNAVNLLDGRLIWERSLGNRRATRSPPLPK